MCKKPLFLSLFLEKRGQIGKKSKKSCCGHQLRTMTYFSKYHTFDPLLYLGCQMLRTHFFFTFSAKNRSNNKIFGKKTYGHQLGPMTHFLTTPKFDLLLYIGEKCAKKPLFLSLSLEKRSNWKKIKKKLLWASTADHDLFFQISHI